MIAAGWPVFPCNPRTKRPLTPHGFKDASVEQKTITEWWLRWPKAMIGVPTGSPIGAFVIDLDAGTDADTGEVFKVEDLLAELERTVGAPLPRTCIAITPRGGRHLYFALPCDQHIGNRSSVLARVDVRGEGGYVIVPSSQRSDGKRYFWETAPRDLSPAVAPVGLLQLIQGSAQRRNQPVSARDDYPETSSQRRRASDRRYGHTALRDEAHLVAAASPGHRNDTLNRAAYRLGQLSAAGELTDSEVVVALERATDDCGLTAEDGIDAVRRTIASGLMAGRKNPRSDHDRGSPPHRAAESQKGDLDRRLAQFELTDRGNSKRFEARNHGRLLYCGSQGWLSWAGQCWKRDERELAARRAIHETVEAIKEEAEAVQVEDGETGGGGGRETKRYKELMVWARTSQSSARMDVIAKHAAPYLEVAVERFDSFHLKLNVRNGTLVFEQLQGTWGVRLAPHDPEDLITKVCDVDYDPDATSPIYDAAFALIQPDPSTRSFLHRVVGYSATGDVSEQKIFFFFGGGRNGKSTFVDLWARILGDFATTIPIERFLQTGSSGDAAKPSPDLARLRGVRMVRTSEPERGSQLAESLIKLTTSGEPMLVRELNRPFFQLWPHFKLTISGNYKPVIKGTDDGIWRRVILVPWSVTLTDEQCDPHLGNKLVQEASGILNHVVAGTLDWLTRGLDVPGDILDATTEYRQSSDHLGRFLLECVRGAPGKRVRSATLFAVHGAWTRATGAPIWKQNGLGRAMRERGYHNTKSGTHYWMDIELVKTEADFKELEAEESQGLTHDPPMVHNTGSDDEIDL